MAFTYKDWHETLPYMGIVFQYIFQQGHPPSFPQYTTRRSCFPLRSKSRQQEFCQSPSLIELKMYDDFVQIYQKELKQTSNKKVRPREFQEGETVPKKVLSSQPDSKGKWTPNHKGSCTTTLTTMDGDKVTRSMNVGAVKKYSVKNKSSISRKLEKAA